MADAIEIARFRYEFSEAHPQDNSDAVMLAHALLAQQAVVEAAVAMVDDDSTSAALTFNRLARAVRAMRETKR